VLGIGYALAASACWGTADFVGGLKSRRLPTLSVLLTIETAGLLAAVVVELATREPFPSTRAAVDAILAGTAGIFALGAFYRALAIGTMSIVAPISATGVALPVIVGLATGDRLHAVVGTGLAVTVVGVMLASRDVHEDDAAARTGRLSIVLALVAALGFGSYFVGADVAADESVLWTVLLGRAAAIPVVGALAWAQRVGVPPRADLGQLALVGLVDLGATALYALANTHGALSIVSVVGSLYPVTTVLLARTVLQERIRPVQAAGVATALTGVAMIAAG